MNGTRNCSNNFSTSSPVRLLRGITHITHTGTDPNIIIIIIAVIKCHGMRDRSVCVCVMCNV